ncbi:hypothetical protein EC988_002416 [Linderina pennispora]|nr:hypothetical protein EC988_002416 [Linderina pennispora]
MEIVNGKLCVFGGKDNATTTRLQDFLLDFRCVKLTRPIRRVQPGWEQLESASRFAMPPLAQQTSVYDRGSRIIVPYGGQTPDRFSKADKIMIFTTTYEAWDASYVSDVLPRRYIHSAVLQESSGDMVVFGGASDATTAGEKTARWRDPARMVLDKVRHRSHLQSIGRLADNATTGTIIQDTDAIPPEEIALLTHHTSTLVNDTLMVVLGGDNWNNSKSDADMVPFDRAHVYNVDDHTWTMQPCGGQVPPPRSGHTAALHKDSIYIFGGANNSNWSMIYNDMYALDTRTWVWREISVPHMPKPRYGHQMKALGHYLIISHEFLESSTGDPDIYFFDTESHTFVDRYSPEGISRAELDTEWAPPVQPRTHAIIAVMFLLQCLAGILPLCLVARSLWRILVARASSRPQRDTRVRRMSSRLARYSETLRNSSIFPYTRTSVDPDTDQATLTSPSSFTHSGRRRASSIPLETILDKSNRQSISEGTSTVIGSDQANQGRPKRSFAMSSRRHSRVMDDIPDTRPYVARRLTVSARLPQEDVSSTHHSTDRIVRFSDVIDEPVIDTAAYDNISLSTLDILSPVAELPDALAESYSTLERFYIVNENAES